MIVYVTKYALTKGIMQFDAEIEGDLIKVIINGYTNFFTGEGNEWHITIDGAKERAEKMRIKKIESLNKQMKKITNMKFENVKIYR